MLGWGARQRGVAGDDAERVLPTRVLGPFLQAISLRTAPALIDLGAVVGSNVTFLGEQLGCRLLVEDVFADIERFGAEGRTADLASYFSERFTQADGTVDGILCWNVFDFLEKPAAKALGVELSRILAPGGALMGFFAATPDAGRTQYTRFVIKDEHTLAHRPFGQARAPQAVLSNRDVARLFPDLKVSDSFLLLSHTREILFRK